MMHRKIAVMELLDLSATTSILALCEAVQHPETRAHIAHLTPEAATALSGITLRERLHLARLVRPVRQEGGTRSHHWWRRVISHLRRDNSQQQHPPYEATKEDALHTLATVMMYVELFTHALAVRSDAAYRLRGRFDGPTIQALATLSEFERVALAMHLADQHFGLPSGKPHDWWDGQITAARQRFDIKDESEPQRCQLANALRAASMR